MAKASEPRRQNRSVLAHAEQRLIQWILPRIPSEVTSLDLTIVGLLGAFVASIALIACNWSLWCLPTVIFGIAFNWFGDSFDGSLARYRKEERPRFGFLVDHTCDLFAQIMLIVAFGLSPFLSIISALSILIVFLLYSAYTYIRATVQSVHQMSYVGIGATEFRIGMIIWACIGAFFGLQQNQTGHLTNLDIFITIASVLAVLALGAKTITDAREIASQEMAALPESNSLKVDSKTDLNRSSGKSR